MNGYQYILSKQVEWARNTGIHLIGSKGDRGRPIFTDELNKNLFQPLLPDVEASFCCADGNELGNRSVPGKMQALHSSSALSVNVFQYWKTISAVSTIASACGFCRKGSQISYEIIFEERFPIKNSFGYHPNIDVVIHNEPGAKTKVFAIECKFSEAYGSHEHDGLKKKYLDHNDLWEEIPELRGLAQDISPDDCTFHYLHPAQLIKHILGLKQQYGLNGFRLLYLWYDVLGIDGKCHQDEIDTFSSIAKRDGVKFHAMTYQELIVHLANELRPRHEEYIKYLTSRYL